MELAKDKALWIYDRMVTIRSFEERVAKLFADKSPQPAPEEALTDVYVSYR
jgi:TPP-dependent pyruvate/acetoin dehydrogenase alpha subunit